jgi:hypothetical protein
MKSGKGICVPKYPELFNMSELQAETSRQNGSQSHGPVSAEGLAKSSQNSLKDGFYATKSILIKGESQEEFDAHCARIRASFEFRTGYEELQVETLCRVEWRILRCDRREAEAENADAPDLKVIAYYGMHHARLEKTKAAVLRDLRESIARREAVADKEMESAMIIRRADRLAKRSTDFKAFGFVLTVEEVDQQIHYERTCVQAARELRNAQRARQG